MFTIRGVWERQAVAEVTEMTPILRPNAPRIQLPRIDEDEITEDESPPRSIINENVPSELLQRTATTRTSAVRLPRHSRRARIFTTASDSHATAPSASHSTPPSNQIITQPTQPIPPVAESNTESSFYDDY